MEYSVSFYEDTFDGPRLLALDIPLSVRPHKGDVIETDYQGPQGILGPRTAEFYDKSWEVTQVRIRTGRNSFGSTTDFSTMLAVVVKEVHQLPEWG